MIIPSDGHVLDVGDYNAIELRVLFWAADYKEGLRALRDGKDLYTELASIIYNRPEAAIEKGSKERFVGKEGILGMGFGYGHLRFQAAVKQKANVDITVDEAKTAVNAYRRKHSPVTVLWKNLESAAIAAVQNPGKRYAISHSAWHVTD